MPLLNDQPITRNTNNLKCQDSSKIFETLGNDLRYSSESHPHSVSDKGDIEETKERYNTQDNNDLRRLFEYGNTKPELGKRPNIKEKVNQTSDFEDDDFKFNMNKITQTQNNDNFNVPHKKRTVSSSALEGKLTPSFCSQQTTIPESFKRFKLSETSTLDSSRVNPFFQNLNPPPQIPSFPFLPNLQVDSDLV